MENYYVEEKLKDNQTVIIRSITSEDKPALEMGFKHLSKSSIYHRFHGPKKSLSANELEYFTEVDHRYHVALLVTLSPPSDGEALAVGRYVCTNQILPLTADLAVTVKDDYQNLGIGRLLLRHLILTAQKNSIDRFRADVMRDNQPMLHLLRNCGLPFDEQTSQGEIIITLYVSSQGC